MFDIGFWEISLILVVMLIVIGPERLPEVARKAGLWINQARRMVSQVKSEVNRELQLEELKRSINQNASLDELKQLARNVNSLETDMRQDLDVPESTANQPTPMDQPSTPEPPSHRMTGFVSNAGPISPNDRSAPKDTNTQTETIPANRPKDKAHSKLAHEVPSTTASETQESSTK